MRVVTIDYRHVPDLPESVCAIGYFDGLHQGHQALIALARERAAALHVQSAVLTFDPDPWKVLRPDADLSHLSSLADKTELLEAMGVDLFYVVRFSQSFAALDVEQFHAFLQSLHIIELVCGFDFTYAARGSGTTQSLQQTDLFTTHVVGEVSKDSEKISSTRIERLIRQGDVAKAGELLGYLYSVAGVIEHGYKRGRQMGFPTANLKPDPEAVLPASGVYAGFVQVKNELLPAMINVGSNPTFDNAEKSVEANILDRSLDLYGRNVRFFFAERLREEVRYPSMDALMKQLSLDRLNTRKALGESRKLWAPTVKLWSLEPVNAILFK